MVENSKSLVSIIIPAYNVEKYLESCIQSILKQDYAPIEIIIVNDGSTDNTFDIIQQYASKYSNIQYVNKKNGGLPLARKSGIEKASGTYVLHLDGDDTLHDGIIKELVDIAEKTNAEIITGPFYFTYPDGHSILSEKPKFETCSPEEYYNLMLQKKAYWSVSANFHKRSLYSKQTIFMGNIPYGEDAILMTQLILNAKKIAATQKPIFNYVQHEASMCHTITKQKDYDTLVAYRIWIENYLKKKHIEEKFGKGMAALYIHNTFEHIYFRCFTHLSRDMKRVNKYLKKYPDLADSLEEKKYRLTRYYKTSRWIGYWKLKDYIKRGRI